jgi:hypothetical protein
MTNSTKEAWKKGSWSEAELTDLAEAIYDEAREARFLLADAIVEISDSALSMTRSEAVIRYKSAFTYDATYRALRAAAIIEEVMANNHEGVTP